MAGYLRFWRRRSIVPGLRMNLSKSGVSWTLGPRGAHFTLGPRRARTIGVPGTGLYYTTYSGHHASRASRRRTATSRASPAPANATDPVPSHRDPMLPATKIAWGAVLGVIGLIAILIPVGWLILLAGAVTATVALAQRRKPMWQARVLIRRAHGHPQEAPTLLEQALKLDPENAESLAASADWNFRSGRWVTAAPLYERYLTHAPDDWLAEGHAANSWLNAGNADAAIPHLLHVREHPGLTDDARASVTAGLAMAYLRKGDPHQALDLARSAPLQRHNLEEGLQQCLFLRALAYYLSGQHSHAISDVDRLANLNPNFPNLAEVRNEMLTGTFTLKPVASAPSDGI